MILMPRRVDPPHEGQCKHRTHFDDEVIAREEARRMSRNLRARVSAFHCKVCGAWFVGASADRAVFDKQDIEILRYLATGLRDRDIAQEMKVQESVVRKRISAMFERSETNSRSQLTALAMHHGIVDYGALMEGTPKNGRSGKANF